MKHETNWLVLFLLQNVHEVEEDTKYLNQVLEQVLEFQPGRRTEVVLSLCTTVLSPILRDNIDGVIPPARPLYSFILRLNPSLKSSRRLQLLATLPASINDFTDARTIKAIFRMVQANFDYKHIALTTWDHGSGNAVFTIPDGVVVGPEASLSHPLSLIKRKKVGRDHQKLVGKGGLMRRFKKNLEDLCQMDPPRGLTMDELSDAIRATFGKVEIILMRNCYMQMFDTGYTLRKVTNYLVATEGLMYFRAYDFNIWLDVIDKDASLQKIAEAAIYGYSRRPTNPEIETRTAMFANELSYYPVLNNLMNKMTAILIDYAKSGGLKELRGCRKEISDIVKPDFEGAPYQLVDARLWYKTAAKLFDFQSPYQKHLFQFLNIQEQMVGGRSVIGRRIGNEEPPKRAGKEPMIFGASGFSLYFPGTVRQITTKRSFYELYYALSSQYKSIYTKDSYWDEFIGILFEVI